MPQGTWVRAWRHRSQFAGVWGVPRKGHQIEVWAWATSLLNVQVLCGCLSFDLISFSLHLLCGFVIYIGYICSILNSIRFHSILTNWTIKNTFIPSHCTIVGWKVSATMDYNHPLRIPVVCSKIPRITNQPFYFWWFDFARATMLIPTACRDHPRVATSDLPPQRRTDVERPGGKADATGPVMTAQNVFNWNYPVVSEHSYGKSFMFDHFWMNYCGLPIKIWVIVYSYANPRGVRGVFQQDAERGWVAVGAGSCPIRLLWLALFLHWWRTIVQTPLGWMHQSPKPGEHVWSPVIWWTCRPFRPL